MEILTTILIILACAGVGLALIGQAMKSIRALRRVASKGQQ